MTKTIAKRQFALLVATATLGALLVVTETHRIIIGWAWDLFLAFHNTFIAY
jgi:hypothetical protein